MQFYWLDSFMLIRSFSELQSFRHFQGSRWLSRCPQFNIPIDDLKDPKLHVKIAMMGFQDVLSAMANLAPFHLFSYSSLVGMSLYQSFTVVKAAHRILPRPAFITLQARLFPTYFQLQTLYLFLTAATFPPYGPFSLVKDPASTVLFSIAGVGTLLNYLVYGPRTRQAMIDRSHTGSQDPDNAGDVEGSSEETVETLNKAFHRSHAMSLHVNLITIAALVGYGWRLALRIKVE